MNNKKKIMSLEVINDMKNDMPHILLERYDMEMRFDKIKALIELIADSNTHTLKELRDHVLITENVFGKYNLRNEPSICRKLGL